MVTRDEDDSILDLRQIEEMMRASQKSNIFSSAVPTEPGIDRKSTGMGKDSAAMQSSDRHYRANQTVSSIGHQQMSGKAYDRSEHN